MPPCDSPPSAPAEAIDARTSRRQEKRKRSPRKLSTVDPRDGERKVERWIGGIACSHVWHVDLVDLFKPRPHPDPGKEDFPPVLTFAASRKACYRLLNQTRQYPPGGSESTMHRCLACGHWTPRNQGEGASGICIDCYFNNLPPERWAWLPASHPMGWAVKVADVKEFLAAGIIRRLRGKTDRQEPGTLFFCEREEALGILRKADRSSRSLKRPLYVVTDPRVCGGPVDEEGVMTDPHLGRIQLQTVVGEVAPQEAA